MALKRHHKIIIGSLSTLVILFMITSSVFTYLIFIKQTAGDARLSQEITDTQSKLNELSDNLLDTKNDLSSLVLQVGSINQDITKLKASISSDFSAIFEKAVKSVVTIKNNAGGDIIQGSGFFIANEGYIVTNAHVVSGATEVTVITYNGNQHIGYLIGGDTNMDIALLKINDIGYNPLTLGNSNNINQLDKVIAIGNPYGLSFSVSEGIVSNIHQQIEGIKAYIQTTAQLNSGNSGGPLINTNGEVIGINTFKISGSEGVGFALESNYIKSTVNNIYQTKYGTNLI